MAIAALEHASQQAASTMGAHFRLIRRLNI
jgi:hypothetical protein